VSLIVSSSKRRHRATLRTRLLTGLLVVAVAVLVAFDVGTVTAFRLFLFHQADDFLDHAARSNTSRAAELLARGQRDEPLHAPAGLAPNEYYVAVATTDGAIVAVTVEPDVRPALPDDLAELARSGRARTVTSTDGTTSFRLRATRTGVGTVVTALNLHSVTTIVNRLEAILAAGTAAVLVVLAAGGVMVVRRGLRPLESMAAQADMIRAGDLSQRVTPHTPHTEVGRLGLALNRMLDRIEASVQEQEASREQTRRFLADASHGLRTPLTSIRANAELYEQGALADRTQTDEAMRRIRVSAHKMSTLVDDMLRLARLDQHPEQRTDVIDASVLVADCVRDARSAGGGRTLTASIQPHLLVRGDRRMLRQAVDNLLSNTHTHTPPGTTASITAQAHGDDVVIEVSDDGPGVPPHALTRLFDRFYQADGPHTGAGSGLGLAIVAEVVAAHGGKATATATTPRGLCVRLTLPTSSTAPSARSVSNRSAERE
jgi:two-component system, OmpR family, sensor kinase